MKILPKNRLMLTKKYGPRYIVKSMLTGTHEFGTLREQMGLDRRTLGSGNCLQPPGAWRHFASREGINLFLNIRQKPEELYEDFISRIYRGRLQSNFQF